MNWSRHSAFGFIFICFVAIGLSANAQAQTTYYVNDACGDDAWSGTSSTCAAPDGPFATIQTAINATVNGDTIILADGVYTGAGNYELDFLGKAITLQSANGPANCRINGYDDVNDVRHPIAKFVTNEDPNTVLEGIDLAEGGMSVDVAGFDAGGVTCIGSSPTLRDCRFTANRRAMQAFTRAGALFCLNAAPMLEDCTFYQNVGSNRGVMICVDSTPTFQTCVFDDNGVFGGENVIVIDGAVSAPSFLGCSFLPQKLGSHGRQVQINNTGTAVFDGCTFESGFNRQIVADTGTNVTLIDSTFRQGNAVFSAVLLDNGTVSNCEFREADNESNNGGALGITGTVNVVDSLFKDNLSQLGAGIFVYGGGTATVDRCRVIANHSFIDAGGIYVGSQATCVVTNSVVADNSVSGYFASGRGGGILADLGANLTIRTSTIANNIAVIEGGGISGPVIMLNSILWGNVPDQHANFGFNVNYSDVEGGAAGAGNIDADPLFLAAMDHDYHIPITSPCVNAGDPGFVADPNEPDIDGDPRIIGAFVDMGADETDPNEPCIGLSTGSFLFTADLGGPNPATQQLDITNGCGGTMNWTVTPDCSWLTPSPASGTAIASETDAVTLSVDIAGLIAGTNTCNLTIEDASASNSPRNVAVTLLLDGTIHVPADFATIQDAVDAAIDGNEILLANGTYTGVGNFDITITGKAVTIRSENGPTACTIHCQGSGRAFNIFDVTTGEVVLEGLKITSGGTPGEGGGVRAENAPMTMRNCVVTNCSAGNTGGGVYARDAETHLLGCQIINNTSTNGVGGITFNPVFTGSIEDCLIAGNVGRGHGGAFARSVLVARCIIEDNVSTDRGVGGILQREPNIEDCIVRNNTCTGSDNPASGYASNFGDPSAAIRRCTIENNHGGLAGGMRINGTCTIERTVVHGNSGTVAGGGVRIEDGDVTLISCQVSDNTAPAGSGVAVDNSGSTVSFQSCTLAGNSNYGISVNGTVTVDNSIVWGNASGSYENATMSNPQTQWSDIEGGASGTGNINTDPLFVDEVAGNYHITGSSPCVNTADPNYVTDPNDFDVDGDPRVVDGQIDKGADEYVFYGDFDGDGDVDLTDFSQFNLCFGGPNNPPAGSCPPGVDADFDNDGDVDLSDFATLSLNFTGPL